MLAILNYRKYVTPSLSTYPRFNYYNTTHYHKRNLGTSSSVYLGYASSSALRSYHHGHETGATGVDEGVPDPALARVWIRPVMIGVEVGDPNLAYSC